MSITNLINKAKANNNVTKTTNEELTMNNEIVTFDEQPNLEVQPLVEAVATTEENNIKLGDVINVNALSSTVAATLFHVLENAQQAIMAACAICDAVELSDNLGMPEAFFGMIESVLESSSMKSTLSGNGAITTTSHEVEVDMDILEAAMQETGLVTDTGEMGAKLIEMLEQRTEAYAPIEVGTKWERRFPLYAPEKGQVSPLAIESIKVLESTQFTKCRIMTPIANEVQAILGRDNDDEAYVLDGCNKMDENKAYISEFKADRRIREYQASCHGPNGQASDRSRACQELVGVPTDYCVETVKKAIKAEVMDMVNIPMNKVGKLMSIAAKDPVAFIVGELRKAKKDRDAAKPWSFVKAALIWIELQKGNRPYIGMAVGLDAKCSGPQLGALMSGDAEVAAACGFSVVEIEDAYHRAIRELNKAGFTGFTMKNRGDIKKPFMGIFYGQSWMAYTDLAQMRKDEQDVLIEELYPNGVADDETAKRFHKAITKSFGKKMVAVRNRFKDFHNKVDGRISHMMPDGSKVIMNYKVQQNILGEEVEYDTACPDVQVTTENNTYKFIKLALNTRKVNTNNFVRNGFVNMIQATDALIARLIIVHLGRLGAKHVISVHDCFRVNVTEMHLLEQAIKNAYMDLFGSRTNVKTKDLPLGTDILGMYFKGANDRVLAEEDKITPISQFMKVSKVGEVRKLLHINRVAVPELINQLGTTYYFAK